MNRRSFLQLTTLSTASTLLTLQGASAAQARAAAAGSTARDAVAAKVPISLIGLPYLMGTRAENSMYGMAQGPMVLLSPENLPRSMRSFFADVEVEMIDNVDEPTPPLPRGDQMARILEQNIALASKVSTARRSGRLPVLSIGTCSATLGVVSGLADASDDLGLLWFDAHSDAETPDTSSSGFIEGMVVPMIAGKSWQRYCARIPGFKAIPEDRIISVSLGSTPWPIPASEAAPVGTPVHKMVLDRIGVEAALGPALEKLAGRCKKVFIHMDADTIDPKYYRNFKARPDITGLSPAQVMEAFDLIGKRFEIVALDVGAFDPTVDARAPGILSSIMLAGAKAAAYSRSRNARG